MIRLLFILSFSFAIHATELLTWEGCVSEASQNNSKVKAAQQTYDSYRYAEFGSYNNFFPQLNGSLNYNYGTSSTAVSSGGGLSTIVGGTSSSTPPASSNYTGTFSLTQNLFNGFLDQAGVEQAKAQKRAYQAALEQAKAQMLSDLKNAYGSLLIAQRQVELQKEIIKRRQKNLELVELQFNSGKENKGSVLLSRAYVNQAKYNALQASDNITTSRAQLAFVLGRDEVQEFVLSEEVP
ncbi:MAG: TolC family protein [Myxococcaceae bacterium]